MESLAPAVSKASRAIVWTRPSASERAGRSRAWVPLVVGFLLLAHLAMLAASARVADCARDEVHYLNSGRIVREHGWVHDATVLQGPLPLFFNQVLVGSVPRGGFSAAEDQGELLWRARLGTLPFALLAAALVFVWSRKLFGDAGGVLSLLFHALNPLVLGYGALLLVDAQNAALVTLVLFLLWRFLETRSRTLLVLVGAALGLALATKYLSLLLVPTLGATVALASLRRAEDAERGGARVLAGLGRAAAAALTLGATALLVLHACYGFRGGTSSVDPDDYRSQALRAFVSVPVVGSLPALLPGPFVRGVDIQVLQGERPWLVYVDGEVASGHRDYYLRSMLYRTPEATLFAAAIVLLWRIPRALRQGNRRLGTAILATVPSLVVWLGYLSFFTRMQLGIRYVLPVYPLLFVALGSLAWSHGRRWRAAPFLGICALVAGLHVRDLALGWPDWISYWNTISGGQRLAFRHLFDSIGSSVRKLEDGGELLRERFGPLQLLDASSGARFGRAAIDADSLARPDPEDPTRSRFDWLLGLDPLGHVGTSWWAFDVTPDSLEERLRASEDLQLRRALALAYLGVGRIEDARRHLAHLEREAAAPLEKLLVLVERATRDPCTENARALLEAWVEAGRPDRAASMLRESPALASSPRGIGVRILARMQERDWSGALTLLERLRSQENGAFRIERVVVLQELGQYERAMAELDRILTDVEERARPPLLVLRAGLNRYAEYYAWLR